MFNALVGIFAVNVLIFNIICRQLFRELRKDAFGECTHNWKTIDKYNLTNGSKSVGTGYELRCTYCGDIKLKKLLY